MAPTKLLGILLLLFILLKFGHSDNKKKIKIHVPYYVKHIHHYKKVYVPKVQVVKHEHVHKKEHEHHHHHDHHSHSHGGYDKADQGSYLEDSYEYDDTDHRGGLQSNRLAKSRYTDKRPYKDEDTSEEELSTEEQDYLSGEDEGSIQEPIASIATPHRLRPRPTPIGTVSYLNTVRDIRIRPDKLPHIVPTKLPRKKIIARITT